MSRPQLTRDILEQSQTAEATAPMIEFTRVDKSFGGKLAVRALSFAAPAGAITGLLGPNGSGKTTTLRLLLGLLAPDRGEVKVLGVNPSRVTADRIGYLPEERGLYRNMRVEEVLEFYAALKGARTTRPKIHDWLERLDVAQWARERVENLSKGTAQKVQFIATLLHDPDLLILDEPFSGLDPVSREQLKCAIFELARGGTTILLSTHDMTLAEQMCQAAVMLHRGAKVLDKSMEAIRQDHRSSRLLVGGVLKHGTTVEDLRSIAGVDALGVEAHGYEFVLEAGADPELVLTQLMPHMLIERFELGRATLNEVFLSLAGSNRAA